MPLLLGLEALEPLIIVELLAFAHTLEHVLNTGHHSLETTQQDYANKTFKLAETIFEQNQKDLSSDIKAQRNCEVRLGVGSDSNPPLVSK